MVTVADENSFGIIPILLGFSWVVERHRRASTVVTSNRDPDEWLALLADPIRAQSAVDRLKNAAYELVVEGQSYRERQKPTLPA